MSDGTFKHISESLSKEAVTNINDFGKVVSALEAMSKGPKTAAWRSAKSVLKKAILQGIPYQGKSKYNLVEMLRRKDSSA